MKAIIKSFFLVALFALTANISFAQNISGDYTATINGKQIYTDRTPVERPISGTFDVSITQSTDEIQVTWNNLASYWSSHRMSGRVGNNRVVCALPSGSKSVYLFNGRVSADGQTIKGRYMYMRYGNGTSGIVPGLTTGNATLIKN